MGGNRLYIKLRNSVAVWFLVAVCRAKQKQLLVSNGNQRSQSWIANAHCDDGKRSVCKSCTAAPYWTTAMVRAFDCVRDGIRPGVLNRKASASGIRSNRVL